MSRSGATPVHWRMTAWLVIAAMLLPTLLACTTEPYASPPAAAPGAPPRAADVARLDGIVVDGVRAVQGREPGLVFVTRDGMTHDGYPGLELRAGDRIETGARAHAVIRYPSGTEVLLRPNSGGRVGSLTEFFGEAFIKVKGLFSVDTTFVKAGARGTAYLVRTYAGGTTGVTVIEGVVEVGSTTGAWPSIPIGAGTTTLAHPRGPQPMAADPDELARTRDWVDRVERLVPPPRGVPTAGIVGAVAIAALIAAMAASGDKGKDASHDRDRPRDTPPPARETPPPRPLEAPHAIGPGAAQAPGPHLDCRRGVTLRWSAVAAARDYAVAMDVQQTGRGWIPLRLAPSGAPEAKVSAEQGLGYANRWSVRARGAGESPPSQTLHFTCDFSGVR